MTGRTRVPEFAAELHRRCEAEGILRTEDGSRLSTLEAIERALPENELEKALELFGRLFKEQNSDELADDLAILSARYRKYKSGVRSGILDHRDATTEHARLVSGLQELLKSARKLPAL